MSERIESLRLVLLGAAVMALALVAATAHAETIYVCWDGSGDYLTIQEGIDAAQDDDEVVVCDGVYTGPGNKNLDFAGKAITVRSANGPDNCIIDCENDGRGFYFHSGETAASVVDGFTITNGNADVGGAIYWSAGDAWYDSGPTIMNCWILGNTALSGGGVSGGKAYTEYGATIANCLIVGNSATSTGMWFGGGGIHASWCELEIRNCTIANNWAAGVGGGLNSVVAGLIIRNCTIAGNQADGEWGGGGVYVNGFAWLVMANCTVTRNKAVCGGGVSFEWGDDSDVISDSVLWANTWEQILGEPRVRYCDVQGGWTGEGNIDADPLFVTGPFGNYYLSQTAAGQEQDSPCVDAGSDTAENLGLNTRTTRTDQVPDSGIVDMGYHYIVCPGDLDGDGDTDQVDLAILLALWGQCESDPDYDPAADLDGDGCINHPDLGILLADYGCGT